MNRHTDSETLSLLREIRDLVQVLVLREMPISALPDMEDKPARKLFTWASLHGNSSRRIDR
jgi:hypothetical protein